MSCISGCNQKRTVILGCGNVLFGDDGFGPAVVAHLEKHYATPEDVAVLDVGTSARGVLFDIALAEKKPKRIVVIDAVDCRRSPGDIATIPVDDLPENKVDDFSLHQVPTSNLLKELRDFCGVEVIVLAAQPGHIPEEVAPGLTKELEEAVRQTGILVARDYF